MTITVVYIVVTHGKHTEELCARFAASWLLNPPGVECQLLLVCNGGAIGEDVACLFLPIDGVRIVVRENDEGRDISGYQHAAKYCESDMLACLGESVHFWRSDWLVPVVRAWEQYGPGFYGFFSSFLVRPHLNTTAFCCAPRHLSAYPVVADHKARYEFEHGKRALWRRVYAKGEPTMLVTEAGVYPPRLWRSPKNIMWRGDQSACLIRCNHVERWENSDDKTKARWSRGADTLREPDFISRHGSLYAQNQFEKA